MNCKNCINSDVCNCYDDEVTQLIAMNLDGEDCGLFKDKSLFVELPCKKGDFVIWQVSENSSFFDYKIFEVKGFCYTDSLGWRLDLGDFSPIVNHPAIKGYYKTKEEAEKALKEREQK